MPFDFDKYDRKCAQMSEEELRLEWNHYTRCISGAAASATLGGSALVFTAGVSMIGVAIGSAGFYNARKKRQIIKRYIDREQLTIRKRDVMGSAAFNTAVGLTTLGLGTLGVDKVLELGVERGGAAEAGVKIATGVVVNGINTAADDRYHRHKKKRETKRAGLGVEGQYNAVQKKIEAKRSDPTVEEKQHAGQSRREERRADPAVKSKYTGEQHKRVAKRASLAIEGKHKDGRKNAVQESSIASTSIA